MKKINNRGFVLAETLIVTVFLLVIFGMIYANFYPLMGEYERRENYDDIDSKYAVYWLKLMVEDDNYHPEHQLNSEYWDGSKKVFMEQGFIRFGCEYFGSNNADGEMCIELLKNLRVIDFNVLGNASTGIYITRYQIGNDDIASEPLYPGGTKNYRYFKDYVKKDYYHTQEVNGYYNREDIAKNFKAYVNNLPDYKNPSPTGAKFRIIAGFENRGGYNTYATMEVDK